MPSFPNYRLGPLDHPGLPCAPVVSTQSPPTPLPAFSVFPNPMGAVLKLIPNRQYNGPARFHLFDVAGQVVREVVFDLRATCTEIDVQALPAGVYFYAVWCEGRMLRAGKVFKVE